MEDAMRALRKRGMSPVRRGILAGAATAAAIGIAATIGAGVSAGDPAPAAKQAGPDRAALRELGRRLFFDATATSRMGMRACADCHSPGHGYADPEQFSMDDTAPTKRHSQTLEDGAMNPSGHWDGEFEDIAQLVRSRMNVRFFSGGGAQYGEGGDDEDVAMSVVSFLEVFARPTPAQVFEVHGVAADAVALGFTPQLPLRIPVPPAPAARAAPLAARPAPARHGGADVLPATATADDVFGAPATTAEAGTFVNESRVTSEPLPKGERALADAGRYASAFRAAFGTETVTRRRIGKAVLEYCHSIESGESAYDRFARGDADALSAAQKRGLELFTGRAGCASCHSIGAGSGARAAFSDYQFHDTGVTWRAVEDRVRSGAVLALSVGDHSVEFVPSGERKGGDLAPEAPFAASVVRTALLTADDGRFVRTGVEKDRRAFKTPSLRDVARRGPYMHDGSLKTLEDVVRHYTRVPSDPNLDAKFPRFSASDADVADLVEFLGSLTGDRRPG